MFEQEQARVLVVDDEAAIRLTLDMLLRRVGYSVTTATNGEEALAWLMQRPFDLLLLDLGLPGMSGLKVAHYAQEYHPSAVVVFLTGSSDFNGVPIEEQEDASELQRVTSFHFQFLTRPAGFVSSAPCD
jgi:CheY-like chemotaxis protein